MNTPNKKRIVGILTMLAALWSGAWGLHVAPEWMAVPTLLTSALVIVIGLTLCLSTFDL